MAKFIRREDKNAQIGLDIGSHSVKAVAISHSEAKYRLIGFSIKPVKDNVIRAIKDAHADLGLTKRKVVASISGPAVVVRYVDMPSMTEDELRDAARFEAEKVIPYNIDDVVLDSAKLEDLDRNKMRAVIVAAKKDLVESQLSLLKNSDLEPLILDVDSFAVMNAFVKTAIDNSNVCGILNIGDKSSNLNIIKGNNSYLSRDIDIGGNYIAKIMAANLSIQEPEAKKLKEDKLSKFLQLSAEEQKDFRMAVEGMLSRISDEVRLSFDFYENRYAGNLGKVYISGGIAIFPDIEGFLKENLGRDAVKWDPLSNIEISEGVNIQLLNESKPQLAVAVGLALRRTEQ